MALRDRGHRLFTATRKLEGDSQESLEIEKRLQAHCGIARSTVERLNDRVQEHLRQSELAQNGQHDKQPDEPHMAPLTDKSPQ
jgi:hypothetical protein